ncbi:hypothetical protein GCM10022202_31660 [Microbacterium marinilacus]|uniref:Uncharacterized protein n=1 Tax=Microbacterium marinilacus TaxID=415209 RepID=A0ABP7BSP4_9MICO
MKSSKKFRGQILVAAVFLSFLGTVAVPAVAADTIYKEGNLNPNTNATSSTQSNLKGGRMGPEGCLGCKYTVRTLNASGAIYASVTADWGVAADMNHALVLSGKTQCRWAPATEYLGATPVICKYRK